MEALRLVDIAPMMLLLTVGLGRGLWKDFHRSFPDVSPGRLLGMMAVAFVGLWLPLLAFALACCPPAGLR